MNLLPVIIRPLIENDIPIAANIAENSMTYPWSEHVFRDCMKANYHGWVLCYSEVQEAVLGFLVVLDQANESQLLNVCVAKDYQRCGYGRFLLEHMISHVQSKNLRRISLEVRASNTSAISVYHALGFVDVGLRKNYYPTSQSSRENAVLMVLELPRFDRCNTLPP